MSDRYKLFRYFDSLLTLPRPEVSGEVNARLHSFLIEIEELISIIKSEFDENKGRMK